MINSLSEKHPPSNVPKQPYIGLFGNHHNNWRNWVAHRLLDKGLTTNQIYDSTDSGWNEVNDSNGDSMQEWINELVRRQHEALHNARCIIFSLDNNIRQWERGHSTEIPKTKDVN